jgi:hypothetical protein
LDEVNIFFNKFIGLIMILQFLLVQVCGETFLELVPMLPQLRLRR